MKIEEAIKQTDFGSEEQKMVVNLIYTGNWILGINAKALKPLGLTTQQFNVLRILKGQHPKPAPVSLVNERMLDKMSNASRLVEKLRQKGLVERSICPEDRRQVDVLLTKAGIDLLQKANAAIKTASKKFDGLSEKEVQQVNYLLDKLRTNGSKIV
jgi:DNA-binding MarR family transcriptional regulator